MCNRSAIGMALVALLAWGAPHADARSADERQTTWEGLSVVVGQRVRILLPDGARIEGKATALEVDALAIEVAKSSHPKTHPKGRFLASRATLRAVDVVEASTKRWRIVCTALGGAFGYVALRGAINLGKSSDLGAAGLGSVAVGLTAAGYSIGNAADRRSVTYVIVQ
jgi:hypothetical protein